MSNHKLAEHFIFAERERWKQPNKDTNKLLELVIIGAFIRFFITHLLKNNFHLPPTLTPFLRQYTNPECDADGTIVLAHLCVFHHVVDFVTKSAHAHGQAGCC